MRISSILVISSVAFANPDGANSRNKRDFDFDQLLSNAGDAFSNGKKIMVNNLPVATFR